MAARSLSFPMADSIHQQSRPAVAAGRPRIMRVCTMQSLSLWFKVLATTAMLSLAGTTAAQFQPTLQGQLRTDAGELFTGSIDLRLSLHTTATGTTPLQQFVQTDVAVSGGVFSVKLPFDSWNYGNATGLLVGIEVKDPSTGWIELTPRRALGAAPVALALPGLVISSPQVVDVNIAGGPSTQTSVRDGAWQSITCVNSGELRAIVPMLRNVGSSSITGTLSIHPGQGVSKPAYVTTTFTISRNSAVGLITLPSGIAFGAGDVFTVQIHPIASDDLLWSGSISSVYPGGKAGTPNPTVNLQGDFYVQTLFTSHTGPGTYTFDGVVQASGITTEGTASIGRADITQLNATAATITGTLTADGAVINGPVAADAASVLGGLGIGTSVPTAQLQVRTPNLPSGFQIHITNDVVANAAFRTTGMRVSDAGFFEVSNAISGSNLARLSGTGAWSAVSDARLKSDISPAEGLLEAALKLRPVTFRWNADGTTHTGLIAQEVRAVLPSFVLGDESREMLTVDYPHLSVVAIGAVQQLEAKVARLERENRELREFRERIEKLEAAMQRLPPVKNSAE